MLNTEQTSVVAADTPIEPQVYDLYADWKKKYNKKYASPDQDFYRLTVFNTNYDIIKKFYEGPKQTYTLDFTQFMDITNEEFVETYLRTIVPEQRTGAVFESSEPAANSVDWRSQGALNEVRNQGGCGSCWAFSAVGAIESAHFVQGKGLPAVSEQELVDCSRSYGNYGCGGGLMDSAFKYVIDHGITNRADYAYAGRDQSCKKQAANFRISSFVDVPAGNCAALEQAASKRPVSVAVDASNWSLYSGGVFNNCQANLNHGVVLVGFNDNEWIVRNSWASSWGEQGHIRLAKGDTCGICDVASYPVV
jgi:C1A family cysteine protease